jgi:hypothetical protein
LAEAAVLHREGSEGLLQDPGLQIALDWFEKNQPNAAWARRYHPEFHEAKKYLEKSCQAREAAELERERQRNAELERERLEREQAEIYAASQARANRKLRLLMVALGLMLVLAMATAAYAFVARRQAKTSEQVALGLRDEAVKQQQALGAALEIKEQADRQRKIADMARVEADKATMKAEAARQEALRDAQEKARIAESEKVKAQREEKRFQDEARRNKKAKEANDAFREAALYVQRGKYQEAKNYFSNAIEGYQDPDVDNTEAIADANVEIGNLAFAVARDTLVRTGDIRRNNIIGNLQTSIGKYDEAAKAYSGPPVNAPEKAAATHFSLAMNLLKFVEEAAVKRNVENAADVDAPGWYGTEGDLPHLDLMPKMPGAYSIEMTQSDPIANLKSTAAEHLREALDYYRNVVEDNKKKGKTADTALEGLRKAAYQLGEFHLKEANYKQSKAPLNLTPEWSASLDKQRYDAVRYFEQLLASYDPNDVARGRLLIWLGGLNLSLSHGAANEQKQIAQKYFDRVLGALSKGNGNQAYALALVADVLKDNDQFAEAAEFYHQAGQAYAGEGDYVKEAEMYVNRGQLYEKLYFDFETPGALDRVDACYTYAISVYTKLGDKAIGQARPEEPFAIGSLYKRFRKFDRALEAFDLAIKFGSGFKRDDIEIYQARAYTEKASILALQNKPREALDTYNQALRIYDKLAAAREGLNGSKEEADNEGDNVRAIVRAIQSGLNEGGTKQP